MDSPLYLDIQDLERDIRLLLKTNDELRQLCSGLSTPEASELAQVVAENERAIESKKERRRDLRSTLGLPDDKMFENPEAQTSESKSPSEQQVVGISL